MTDSQISDLAISTLHGILARHEVTDALRFVEEAEATLAASLASRTAEPEFTAADVVDSLLALLA